MKYILLTLKMFVVFIFVLPFKSVLKKCFKSFKGQKVQKQGSIIKLSTSTTYVFHDLNLLVHCKY